MQVIILCGGLGTRLREYTETRPKPSVEVGGRPVLWHVMKTYAHHGIHDFVLSLGYKGHIIKDYFVNYRSRSSDFTIEPGGRGPRVPRGARRRGRLARDPGRHRGADDDGGPHQPSRPLSLATPPDVLRHVR